MNTLERKSIPIQIILTIFTCGFYGIYWLYCIIRDINIVSGDPNSMSPVVVILLSFVTCNIYFFYWVYKAGVMLDQKDAEMGKLSENRPVIYLLFSIFGLSIVTMSLLQDTINQYADNFNSFNNKTTF